MIYYDQILTANYPDSLWQIQENNYDTLEWYSDTPKPTKAELDALAQSTADSLAKEECKKQASELLYETDWTTIPDVADSSNVPYLTNQAEFITYRSQIRNLAITPVANPVFPQKPEPQWILKGR
jgi:hypothetical protein